MAIVKVMNKDETGTSPANKVTGEVLAVTKGTPQKLAHSIFFSRRLLYLRKAERQS